MSKRTTYVFLFTLIFALLFSSSQLGPVRVEAQQTFFGAQRAPAITTGKSGDLYLMMSVATKPAGAGTPGSQIFFTMSKDGGATWNNFPETRNLSKSRGEAFGPSVDSKRSGKGNSYVVYHDNTGGTTQAYLIRSKKAAKFKGTRNITPHDGGAFGPRIALDSNEQLNIVWGDTQNNGKQVAFIRSTDQGDTFGELVNVSRSPGEAFEPEIAVAPDNSINVAWEDTRSGVSTIMFARSTDGGQTFLEPVAVSSGEGRATEAHISADSAGRIHVAWIDESGGDSQAFYSRSTDGGQTFSAPLNLSNEPGAEIEKPFVTTSGESVYVAYNDRANNSRQAYLVKSDDGGERFGGPEQVSRADRTKGRAHSVAMTADSRGVLHLVWIDSSIVGRDEGVLFYSNTRNGRTFSAQQLILAVIQQ
jgi:hypothetical protein